MAERILVLFLASVGAAALATAATAQEARKYYRVDTVTVSEVDPETHVLAVTDGEGGPMRFVVDEKTTIQEGAEEIALEDLEPGDRVAVNARAPVPDVESHPLIADVIIVVNEEVPAEEGSGSPGS